MARRRATSSIITLRLAALIFLCAAPLAITALTFCSVAEGGLALVVGSIVFAIIASLLVSEAMASSLDRFARFAERLTAGQLGTRVEPSRLLQFNRLAQALNEMARNVAGRVEALDNLSREQDTILRSMVEGVISVDSQGRIQRLNKTASALLDASELLSKDRHFHDVVEHLELQQFMEDALRSSEPLSSMVTVKKESALIFEVYSSILRSESADSNGRLIVLHDMTRIQRLENIRRDFVANVSHELRTPITSIKGFVETLLDGAMHEPESLQRFLGIIGKHSERLHSILSDLLTLARLEAGDEASLELAPAKVAGIVALVVESCSREAAQKQIEISNEVSAHERVVVNAGLVEQALVNLVSNAVKYSQIGAQVAVRSEVLGEMMRIDVVDTGPGIDKSHLPRLFERFYRLDQGRSREMGGTGLGLAIVKHIAQLHGGRVEVSSELGKGTTFSLYLKHVP
jgi:two-component system phosphate regulon sensor histidine kinase PhoR